MTITSQIAGNANYEYIIIYIDDLLHLKIPKHTYIYSWWEDDIIINGQQTTRWFIEYAHDFNIKTEYTTEEKWTAVLKELRKYL